MDKKNLIISAFSGYNYNQLKPYLKSIDESVSECDKVMITGSASSETIDKLLEHGWIVERLPDVNVPIHVARFLAIYEFLRNHHENYRWVVSTDVKDVIFQECPFRWIIRNLMIGSEYIIAGSESIRYKDEPWGNENLLQTYGPFVHERFKDNIIYNVGTLGGHASYIKDLVFQIFFNGINRPIPIVDQAVFNFLIQQQPYKDIIYKATNKDGWAVQLGTSLAGVKSGHGDIGRMCQNNPTELISYQMKYMDDQPDVDNLDFTIIHQYDRVTGLKENMEDKYANS